ncbi:MAG: N-acetylmuramoyl-L-alanine amidase, partial [Armatimonadetes bacterium]|nr:N-acetylmuramoyl-L-alanine amidase [Armatimonadota bacterium]
RRAEIANSHRAALLIRLHCDATGGSGFATYFPDRSATLRTTTGPPKDVIAKSARYARAFHAAAVKVLGADLQDRGLHTDRHTAIGSRQGALTGSIYSKVPVLLAEMCVLTNEKDEAFIKERKGQLKMAKALLAGVEAAIPRPRRPASVCQPSARPVHVCYRLKVRVLPRARRCA